MSLQGWAFVLMLGVAIGTAVYQYFENTNTNQHTYGDSHNYYRPPPPPPPPDDGRPRRKDNNKRRNSNRTPQCSICSANRNTGCVQSLNCGHIFHFDCIKRWSQERKTLTCPNCGTLQT